MKQHWLYLTGAAVVLASAAGACASKVGSNASTSTTSGSTTSSAGGAGATTTSGTSTGGDMTAGSGGAGGKCSTPGTLHAPKQGETKTIYCPFSGMPNIYCTKQTEHCCEPGSGTSTCKPIASTCGASDTDWQCQDPSDCPNGQVCCSNDMAVLNINADTNCANFANGFKGTHCAASCLATEITMCTADAACGAKKCTPFNTKGAQVGGCH